MENKYHYIFCVSSTKPLDALFLNSTTARFLQTLCLDKLVNVSARSIETESCLKVFLKVVTYVKIEPCLLFAAMSLFERQVHREQGNAVLFNVQPYAIILEAKTDEKASEYTVLGSISQHLAENVTSQYPRLIIHESNRNNLRPDLKLFGSDANKNYFYNLALYLEQAATERIETLREDAGAVLRNHSSGVKFQLTAPTDMNFYKAVWLKAGECYTVENGCFNIFAGAHENAGMMVLNKRALVHTPVFDHTFDVEIPPELKPYITNGAAVLAELRSKNAWFSYGDGKIQMRIKDSFFGVGTEESLMIRAEGLLWRAGEFIVDHFLINEREFQYAFVYNAGTETHVLLRNKTYVYGFTFYSESTDEAVFECLDPEALEVAKLSKAMLDIESKNADNGVTPGASMVETVYEGRNHKWFFVPINKPLVQEL